MESKDSARLKNIDENILRGRHTLDSQYSRSLFIMVRGTPSVKVYCSAHCITKRFYYDTALKGCWIQASMNIVAAEPGQKRPCVKISGTPGDCLSVYAPCEYLFRAVSPPEGLNL